MKIQKFILASVLVSSIAISACGTEHKQVAEKSKIVKETEDPNKKTVETSAPTTQKPSTESLSNKKAHVVLVDSGFTINTDMIGTVWGTAGLKIKNDGTKESNDAEAVISWLNAAGTPVKTSDVTFPNVSPGSTVIGGVEEMDLTGVTAMKVDIVYTPEGTSFSIPSTVIPVTNAVASGTDDYDHTTKLSGRAKNTSTQVLNLVSVDCLTHNAEGKINGFAETYINTMPPGAEIAFEGSTHVQWNTAECTASGTFQ